MGGRRDSVGVAEEESGAETRPGASWDGAGREGVQASGLATGAPVLTVTLGRGGLAVANNRERVGRGVPP